MYWYFYSYSAQSAATCEERLIRALNIESDTPAEVASVLNRYLSYEHIESGRAADNAREDLDARIRARKSNLCAWGHLVAGGHDGRLLVLLTEAAAQFDEGALSKKDIEEFLGRLGSGDHCTVVPKCKKYETVSLGTHYTSP